MNIEIYFISFDKPYEKYHYGVHIGKYYAEYYEMTSNDYARINTSILNLFHSYHITKQISSHRHVLSTYHQNDTHQCETLVDLDKLIRETEQIFTESLYK